MSYFKIVKALEVTAANLVDDIDEDGGITVRTKIEYNFFLTAMVDLYDNHAIQSEDLGKLLLVPLIQRASPRVNLKIEEILERRGATIKSKLRLMKRIEDKVQGDFSKMMEMLRANEENVANDMLAFINQTTKEKVSDEMLEAVHQRVKEDNDMIEAIAAAGGSGVIIDGTE